MRLIQETGEGLQGANTYVSESLLDQYCADNSLSYRGSPSDCLLSAMFYIERLRFKGRKKSPDQPLEWPRTRAEIDRRKIPDTSIPQELKDLQCELAILMSVDVKALERGELDIDDLDPGPSPDNGKVKELERKLTRQHGGMVVCLFNGD